MKNNYHLQYDAICYATFINVKTLSNTEKTISLKGFNRHNKEHLFFVSVINACWSILGEKDITADCSWLNRRKLKKIFKRTCQVNKATKKEKAINIDEVLNFMRTQLIYEDGDPFTFADIYDEYYAEKRRK